MTNRRKKKLNEQNPGYNYAYTKNKNYSKLAIVGWKEVRTMEKGNEIITLSRKMDFNNPSIKIVNNGNQYMVYCSKDVPTPFLTKSYGKDFNAMANQVRRLMMDTDNYYQNQTKVSSFFK